MEPLSSCMSLKSAESSSVTEVAGYLYSHFCWAALVDTLDAIEPLCFQAGCHKRRLNLALVFLCLFCVVVFFVQCFVGAFLQATSRVPRWWIGERPPDMAASCDIYK